MHIVDLRNLKPKLNKNLIYLIGGIFLLLLLLLFSLLIPILNNYRFKKKYIRKYSQVKKANITKKDPLTMLDFHDEDEVVVIGNDDKMMLLNTWKYLREKGESEITKDYADFFNTFPNGSFFSQVGLYMPLNKFWFGILGGYLSWIINDILNKIEFLNLKSLFSSLFNQESIIISESIFNQSLASLSIGIGITLTVHLVIAPGQSLKFSFSRLFYTTLQGGVICFIVSLFITPFILIVLPHIYWAGFLEWTIFSLVLLLLLSTKPYGYSYNQINLIKVFTNGILTSTVSFNLYFFMNNANYDSAFVQMLGFMSFGGIIGLTLNTIYSQYNATIELLFLSPPQMAGKITPIDKWLKSPDIDFITIGTNPTCDVYIKGKASTEIEEQHAKLEYLKGSIYIQPIDGHVSVNEKLIKKSTLLNYTDIIHLGLNKNVSFKLKKENQVTLKSQLVIIYPPLLNKKTFNLKPMSNSGYLYIGSDIENIVHLAGGKGNPLKEKHAKLLFSKEKFSIEPCEGDIWVNNLKVKNKQKIKNGDTIRLGNKAVYILKLISTNEPITPLNYSVKKEYKYSSTLKTMEIKTKIKI